MNVYNFKRSQKVSVAGTDFLGYVDGLCVGS